MNEKPQKCTDVSTVGCLCSLDWATGLDYWADFFANKNQYYALQLDSPTSRVANYVYISL